MAARSRAQEELRSQSKALQAAEETASGAAEQGQRLEPLLTEMRRTHINTEAALFRPVSVTGIIFCVLEPLCVVICARKVVVNCAHLWQTVICGSNAVIPSVQGAAGECTFAPDCGAASNTPKCRPRKGRRAGTADIQSVASRACKLQALQLSLCLQPLCVGHQQSYDTRRHGVLIDAADNVEGLVVLTIAGEGQWLGV